MSGVIPLAELLAVDTPLLFMASTYSLSLSATLSNGVVICVAPLAWLVVVGVCPHELLVVAVIAE